MKQRLVVSVIGGSSCSRTEAEEAEAVGRGLAEEGCVILCGGGSGVMEAVCKGASDAGGLTVGLLPGRDPALANPYVTVPIPTGLGSGRNLAVALGGRVVIAIGGSHGTLSEIAFALEAGRPVVGLGTWKAQDREGTTPAIRYANQAMEAVQLALEAVETEA